MLRLFVGIAVPDRVRAELVPLQAGLPRARWTRPENLHVTVRFIGEVDRDLAEDIHVALSGLHAPAFELAVRGLGSFETGGRVRLLWAGIEGSDPLVFLRDKVESALVRLGLAAERRKFRPHLTLARFNNEPVPNLFQYFALNGAFAAGAFNVRRFTLFQSVQDADGTRYQALEHYPLIGFPDAASFDDDQGPEWGWDEEAGDESDDAEAEPQAGTIKRRNV